MKLKVMSYNIWSGKSIDKIIDIIKDNDIDIIGLQEVDNDLKRSGNIFQAKYIAEKLGFHFVYGPAMKGLKEGPFAQGEYGNAIMSRFPIVKSKVHEIGPLGIYNGMGQTEPRVLIETRIDVKGKEIAFFTTHFSYSDELKTNDIKKEQTKILLDVIKKIDIPVILTGDFNSVPESFETQEIKKHLVDTDKEDLKTWPIRDFDWHEWKVNKGLKYKIDYIFVSDDIEFENTKIIETDASDHVPILTQIKI